MVLGVCVALAVLVLAVYGRTLRYEFVNYDDAGQIYQVPQITSGLTLKGIAWAFTHSHNGHWIPLNTISHMLDCQLYGLNAGGHHLTNVLLHAASAIMLFLILRRMTATLWPAAFVAALFAVHPLHVESVAWVAERKDVLSGFFFMLTLGAYVRYVQRQSRAGSREAGAGKARVLDYGLVLLCFACGLMSKLMVATLPLVLLVLDYWPLNRFAPLPQAEAGDRPNRWLVPRRLMLEKIPLLGVLLLAGLGLFFSRHENEMTYGPASPPSQTGRALLTPLAYLRQMVYPAGLNVSPPPPDINPSGGEVMLGIILLAAISAAFFLARRRRPYLLVGWLWYLLILAPVLVLIQKHLELRCDRYTYLPLIGVYLLLTWTVADLSASWRHRRLMTGAGAVAVIAALIWRAQIQTSYWRNSESLWTHALACNPENPLAYCNLGSVLADKGQIDEAIDHYQKALEIQPDYVGAQNNLGTVLFQNKRLDEAIVIFQKVLKAQPGLAEANNNLGAAFFQKGQINEAIAYYRKAVAIQPLNAEFQSNLGYALFQGGKVREAIAHYQTSLEIEPKNANTCNDLAWALATSPEASIRNGIRAVTLAEKANQLSRGTNPAILGTLAAAYAEAGRFPEAVENARRAQQLAIDQSNPDPINDLKVQIKLYQAGSPYRDTSQTNTPDRAR